MKILHVLNHSLPHVDGYSVRSANVLRLQCEDGLTPIALTSPRQEPVSSVASERIDGILHYRTAPPRAAPPAVRPLLDAKTVYQRIAAVLRCEQPSVIHAHSPSPWGAAAAVAARRHRLPFVYEVRGCWEDAAVDAGTTRPASVRYRLTRALETWVLRRAAAVTTICAGLAYEISARGISSPKLFLTPNGVDGERFAPLPRDAALAARLQLPPDGPTVGFVGSLLACEGVEDLVASVPVIMRRVPGVHVIVAGVGPRLDPVRMLQQRLPQPDRVHIVGAVPASEVRRYYSLLDVVIYPRRPTRQTEMVTPLKPLEAMAMQKAVLVADVGGLRELVDAAVGATFRAGDVEHLAEQCIALLSDPARRAELGREARRHVLATRSWRRLAPIYRAAYAAASDR